MDRLNLTLDIQANSLGARRVNVRSSLQVATLVATIKDKFNLDGNYNLRMQGTRTPLPLDTALDQIGVPEGSTLQVVRIVESTGVMDAIARGVRQPFSKRFTRVYLREQRTLAEFDLRWQPSIIGRRDVRNPSNNRLLIVDLEDLETLPSVSRHHAAITEQGGSFYIESIQDRNPTLLDGVKMRISERYPLQPGMLIKVGNITLSFQIIG
ncbi:MAG TPA: FHA domain-containing protein [Anaerolineae bacterium]